jgi:hypothetical protein
MGHFLVERYVSAAGQASLADEVDRLSADPSGRVRLLLTLYTPEEESCLHVFDAPSLTLVEVASQVAGVVFDRVSPVITIEPARADLGVTL